MPLGIALQPIWIFDDSDDADAATDAWYEQALTSWQIVWNDKDFPLHFCLV